KKQLQIESRSQNWKASRTALEPKIDQVQETLTRSDFWTEGINIEEKDRNFLTNKFLEGRLACPELDSGSG
ncbi:MAG: hypothetical protein R6U20_01185, partial [Longimonas sp.]|uniref:hypothetical protein n=1 Tax=Longimonas sp. TaxID=2039626 RepID=UPI00397718E5